MDVHGFCPQSRAHCAALSRRRWCNNPERASNPCETLPCTRHRWGISSDRFRHLPRGHNRSSPPTFYPALRKGTNVLLITVPLDRTTLTVGPTVLVLSLVVRTIRMIPFTIPVHLIPLPFPHIATICHPCPRTFRTPASCL